jgi:hypothetical protein
MTLAAFEAWRQFGGANSMECIEALNEQFLTAVEANEKDDLVDDDEDGECFLL